MQHNFLVRKTSHNLCTTTISVENNQWQYTKTWEEPSSWNLGPSWTFLWLLIPVIYLTWVPLLPSSSSRDPHLELLGELVPTISTSPPQAEASKKKLDAFSNCGNSKYYQPPHSFISVLPQITPRWCLHCQKASSSSS